METKLQIGLLEGKSNWSTWRYKVCILLRSIEGALDAVEGRLIKPTLAEEGDVAKIRFTTPKPTSRATVWDALLTCSGDASTQKLPISSEHAIKTSPEITSKVPLEDNYKVSADSSFEYTDSSIMTNSVTNTLADLCPHIPPGLGPVSSSEDLIESVTKNTFGEIFKGGYFKTIECRPRQSVAIIVAHSGDKKLLKLFLYYVHSFLIKQQSEYQIYIVENANQSAPLNRGQLFNIGFSEVQRQRKRDWSCIILHEAYLIPSDMRNLYRCSWYPKQLVAVIGKSPDMQPKVGGVVAVSPQIYSRVNGFSNLDWKSDTEYADFYQRVLMANGTVERSDINIGKYQYLKLITTGNNSSLAQTTTYSPLHNIGDGLYNLSYKADIEHLKLYTHINASINSIEMETLNKLNLLLGRDLKRTTIPDRSLKQSVL